MHFAPDISLYLSQGTLLPGRGSSVTLAVNIFLGQYALKYELEIARIDKPQEN